MHLHKHFLFLLLFSFTYSIGSAQSSFQLSYKKDLSFSIIGSGTSLAAFIGQQNITPLTEAQINKLDRNSINKLDRIATYNWNPKAITASDYLLYSSALLPYTLALSPPARDAGFGKIAIMGLETFLLTEGITGLTKFITKRTRPFVYNPDVPMSRKLGRDTRLSFFSGHTSHAAAGAFFFAYTFHQLHPDSNARYWVWGLAALVPATVGFLRVYAGKHFVTDVIIGYAIGASIGVLVPALHKR